MYSLSYSMIVSIIEMGAGSSGESTRPILPTALFTSGTLMMRRSSSLSMSVASPIDAWGIVVGMYKNAPSSSEGMNSDPMPGKSWASLTMGSADRTRSGSQPQTRSNPSQTLAPVSSSTSTGISETSL